MFFWISEDSKQFQIDTLSSRLRLSFKITLIYLRTFINILLPKPETGNRELFLASMVSWSSFSHRKCYGHAMIPLCIHRKPDRCLNKHTVWTSNYVKAFIQTLKDSVLLVQQYKSKEYFVAKPIRGIGSFYLLFQKLHQLWKVMWAVLTNLVQGNLVGLEGKAPDFWPRFYIVVLGMTFFFVRSHTLFSIFYLEFYSPYYFPILFGIFFPFYSPFVIGLFPPFISLFYLDFYFNSSYNSSFNSSFDRVSSFFLYSFLSNHGLILGFFQFFFQICHYWDRKMCYTSFWKLGL